MKKGIIIFIFAVGIIFSHACKKKKDDTTAAPTTPLVFTSLASNPSFIDPGETSTITAVATGDHVTYKWSMSHGDLFGSGSVVTFSAQPCCAGTNTVTCVVSDGNSSLTKTATIDVRPH